MIQIFKTQIKEESVFKIVQELTIKIILILFVLNVIKVVFNANNLLIIVYNVDKDIVEQNTLNNLIKINVFKIIVRINILKKKIILVHNVNLDMVIGINKIVFLLVVNNVQYNVEDVLVRQIMIALFVIWVMLYNLNQHNVVQLALQAIKLCKKYAKYWNIVILHVRHVVNLPIKINA
jgi:hypothetical protein